MFMIVSALDAFEIVEGLEAFLATIKGFAGGGSELADPFGVFAAAMRAGNDLRFSEQAHFAGAALGWRDTERPKLFFAFVCDPVGGPGRGQNLFDFRIAEASGAQRLAGRGVGGA